MIRAIHSLRVLGISGSSAPSHGPVAAGEGLGFSSGLHPFAACALAFRLSLAAVADEFGDDGDPDLARRIGADVETYGRMDALDEFALGHSPCPEGGDR